MSVPSGSRLDSAFRVPSRGPRDAAELPFGAGIEVIEVPREMSFPPPPAKKAIVTLLAEFLAQPRRPGQGFDGMEQFVIGPIDKAAAAILDRLRQRAQIPHDDRRFPGERFHADH